MRRCLYLPCSQVICKLLVGFDLLKDQIAMIVEISQRGMHIRQGNLRKIGHDLVGTLAVQIVPDVNVVDANAGSGDAWLAAAFAWLRIDVRG